MNSFKRIAAVAALTLCAASVWAQQQQMQDGIAVRPLSRWRVVVPEEVVEQQSAQQYLGLLQQASQQGVLFPSNDPQVQRLRGIAQRIIPFAPRWNPEAANWKWQVNLIKSKTVNAFCMPGGRIVFYSGLIDSLKMTDDEIAAVMGHEVAHALREHGREQMAKSGATSLFARGVGALLAGKYGLDPNMTDYAARTGAQLVSLKFSRDDEREADLVGLDIASRAGFDPRAGVALWQKMATLSQSAPPELLSTHPGGPERIDRIRNNLPLLLPVYAKAKGTTVDRLPAYRTTSMSG